MKDISPSVNSEKRNKGAGKRLIHSIPLKVAIFALTVFMLCLVALAAVGVITMFKAEVYQLSRDANKDNIYSKTAYNDCYNLMLFLSDMDNGVYSADEFIKYSNIGMVISESENPEYSRYEKKRASVDERFIYTYYWYIEYNDEGNVSMFRSIGNNYDADDYIPENVYSVTLGISSELTESDDYFWYGLLIDVLYVFRFWVYPLGFLALITAVLCIVFLLVSAGRKRDVEGITPTVFTKIPFDIPTALCFAAIAFGLFTVKAVSGTIEVGVLSILWFIGTVVILLFWLMSLSLRLKLGTVIKNTLIYRFICFMCRGIRAFAVSAPLIWKTLALFTLVSIIEFITIVLTIGKTGTLVIWWIVGKLIFGFVLIYIAVMLRRLKAGASKIADGDLNYKVDTASLILDFKNHGEDLNRIGEVLNSAVEEQLKSERMKTELITNVSHDIKTPLTSIINYSDLISREQCDNANIKEYAAVLHNHSERMKRLIEDLVEASKASSGNIEIVLDECDAGVILSQLSGEFDQILADAGLELVCSAPQNEVIIMADGRRIWRVFDNLMGNARKYALPGTRVYVTLEDHGDTAVFIFKNISREALNIDVKDLTERFVRGDKSRNTEGNGLGLSIAKSLTELQGGSFEITLDGDLFKVSIGFQKV